MKKLHTILFLLLVPLLTFAQKDFYRFSIGAGGGFTQIKGDVSNPQHKKLYLANGEIYITPYIAAVLEGQVGHMGGLDYSNNRYFESNYQAATAMIKVYLGQALDKYRGAYYRPSNFIKVVEGIFGGVGGGAIRSNHTSIYRQKDNPMYDGKNLDRDIFIPVSVGIDNSGFNSRVIAGVRYQYNFAQGDQIDGYSIDGTKNDAYNTFTVSIKYKFGLVREER